MRKSVTIIGGGRAAVRLASFLDPSLFHITLYEKNKTPGRKFLVAGKGGFNLTHSEPIESFIERYTPSSFIKEALLCFDNKDLREWLSTLDIQTFVGSSNRVYPTKGIKPIEVLNAITSQMKTNGVTVKYESIWKGWTSENNLKINDEEIKTDYIIFALGGGSWKITGSDGSWLSLFKEKGVKTLPFQPSNCAYEVLWKKGFLDKNEGQPLKNISITCSEKTQKGEVVITSFGIEGNAIYALSPQIQTLLQKKKQAQVFIDLKPMLSETEIVNKLNSSKNKNTTQALRNSLKLSNTQIDLLKHYLGKNDFTNHNSLGNKIKNFPLTITCAAPLDQAISTTGGISLDQVNSNFELQNMNNTFCIGEMLDWNAPTGGYLLQACFSMGVKLANHLNQINSQE